MEHTSDLVKVVSELREEVASLKDTITSLIKAQPQTGTPNTLAKQEFGFTTVADSQWVHPSFLTKKDIEEIREKGSFKMSGYQLCSQQSKDDSAPKRFVEFTYYNVPDHEGKTSEYFDSSYGVYTLPLTGPFRFRVEGSCTGRTMEWFICCDGDDQDAEVRPVEFDIEEEFQSFENEKRLRLFTTTGDDENCGDKMVGLYGRKGMHVWIECYQKGESSENTDRFCRFSGLYLE